MSSNNKLKCTNRDTKSTSEDKMRIQQSKNDLVLLSTTIDPKQQAFLTFANGQTPTPTSLLKNCDELGLELDQKDDIFSASFKNANSFHSYTSVDFNANESAIENLNTPTPQFMSRSFLHNLQIPSKSFHIPASPLVQSDVVKTIETRCNDALKSVVYQSMAPPIVTKTSPIKKRVLETLKTPHNSITSLPVSPPRVRISPKFTSPTTKSAETASKSLTTLQTVPAAISPKSTPKTSANASPSNMISDSKIMLQVMLDVGNGQKIPMNIPAASFGISCNSLPSLISKDDMKSSSSSPPPTAVDVASSLPIKMKPPQIVITNPDKEIVSPTAKQQLKAALQKQCINNNIGDNLKYLKRIEIDDDNDSYDDLNNEISMLKHPKLMNDDEDEGRRSKFLERNRAAAARCRKKKKVPTATLR